MMQYILTQDEKNGLVPKEELQKRDEALEAARILILAQSGWIERCGKHVCDNCPISDISHDVSILICKKPRYYSK